MMDYNNYALPNFFGVDFYLSQNDFAAPNVSDSFNIWSSYTFPSIPIFTPQFNFFDFTLNNSFFPSINFNQSLFSLPVINPSAQIVKSTPSTDSYISLEPEETDNEIATVEPAKRTNKSGKTSRAANGLDSYVYIAEEITPGYYIQKARYANLKDMKPYMKETLIQMDKKAKELGYTMVVVDGFRRHETQAAAKKRKPKLCAPPGKSAHEYGVAVDIALFKNGKQVRDIRKEVPEFGRYAQSLNMDWGATWLSKYEPWHFNFNDWQELADVRNEYRSWNNLA